MKVLLMGEKESKTIGKLGMEYDFIVLIKSVVGLSLAVSGRKLQTS